MMDFQTVPDTNIVELTIDGDVDTKSFDAAVAHITTEIANHGKVRLLQHIKNLGSMPISRFQDDVTFRFRNWDKFTHVAVVADATWIEMMTKAASPFSAAEVKYFEGAQLDEAKEWLHQATVAH